MASTAVPALSRCSCTLPAGRVRAQNSAFGASAAPCRRLAAAPLRPVAARGSAGQEAFGSWIDLANFVSSSGSSGGHTPYDELADKIGRDVYIDVAGWHLYLKDVKVGQGLSLAQALAAQLGPKLQSERRFREEDLTALLKKVPIKLGAGRLTAALSDLVPAGCMRDFERACEDYARNC